MKWCRPTGSSTLWGLSLQVPILSSGMRANPGQAGRYSIDQAAVNLTATEQRLIS